MFLSVCVRPRVCFVLERKDKPLVATPSLLAKLPVQAGDECVGCSLKT